METQHENKSNCNSELATKLKQILDNMTQEEFDMEWGKILFKNNEMMENLENTNHIELITNYLTELSVCSVWQATPLLRWRRVDIDQLRYDKVLQQLWRSNTGEEEWRDVPEEN